MLTASKPVNNPSYPRHSSDVDALDELLRSNRAPLDSEREKWQGAAEHCRSRIREIDVEIDAGTKTSHSLIQDRREATNRLAKIHTILHPVRMMPWEIIEDIFFLCARTWEDICTLGVLNPDSLDTTRPPWTLAQVCTQWRWISLSCSRLWSCIHLDLLYHIVKRHTAESMATKLAIYMGRSGRTRDLDVVLYAYVGRAEEHFNLEFRYHPAFELIVESTPRWVRACLASDSPEMRGIVSNDFPRLVYLSVVYVGPFTDGGVELIPFGTMPLLKTLATSKSETSRYLLCSLDLPLTQIRSLDYGPVNLMGDDVSVINRMPYLKTLTANVTHHIWGMPNPPLRLPSVSTLTLEETSETKLTTRHRPFFHVAHIPALSDLSIIMRRGILVSLPLPPAPGQISTLSISYDIGLDAAQTARILEFLSMFPNVESLKLASPSLPMAFLRALTCNETSEATPLLPMMGKLSLVESGGDVSTYESLLCMLESRIWSAHVAHIEDLHIPQNDYDRLRDLEPRRWNVIAREVRVLFSQGW